MIYNVIAIIIAAVVCFLFTQGVKASVDSIYNKAKILFLFRITQIIAFFLLNKRIFSNFARWMQNENT